MTTPKQGIEEGELFGYGPQALYGNRWMKSQGLFSLGMDGDNIFLYCKNSLNKIRFLSAFSNFGSWSPELMGSYATNASALPSELLNSTITLPHHYNYFYNGPRNTRISLLRQSIRNASLWEGSDMSRYEIGGTTQVVQASGTFSTPKSAFCGVMLVSVLASYLIIC